MLYDVSSRGPVIAASETDWVIMLLGAVTLSTGTSKPFKSGTTKQTASPKKILWRDVHFFSGQLI